MRSVERVYCCVLCCVLLSLQTLFAPLGPSPIRAQDLPAGAEDVVERLSNSPRHGEWLTVPTGGGDEVRAWIVYPERSDAAPVVLVIQEIFGMTDWIRAVADQLAADGFIAIAPDLLSGKGPGGGDSDSVDQQGAVALVRELDRSEVNRRLQATAEYATALPASSGVVASIGFCWGGGVSFTLATAWSELAAAVVYYGTSPGDDDVARVRVPILGLYGGDDARVNATIEPAQAVLAGLGGRYEVEIYEGAGHGFLRQQDGRDGANLRASEGAWSRTVAFLQEVLE
jgi:carboxymethylenebutenolidase